MDKLQFVSAMSMKIDLPFRSVQNLLDAILDCITEELIKGNQVKLVNFGSFEIAKRAPRKGFNPHTKQEVLIPECNEPIFKPGKEFKKIIKNS